MWIFLAPLYPFLFDINLTMIHTISIRNSNLILTTLIFRNLECCIYYIIGIDIPFLIFKRESITYHLSRQGQCVTHQINNQRAFG